VTIPLDLLKMLVLSSVLALFLCVCAVILIGAFERSLLCCSSRPRSGPYCCCLLCSGVFHSARDIGGCFSDTRFTGADERALVGVKSLYHSSTLPGPKDPIGGFERNRLIATTDQMDYLHKRRYTAPQWTMH
jgi:hypothetical protein